MSSGLYWDCTALWTVSIGHTDWTELDFMDKSDLVVILNGLKKDYVYDFPRPNWIKPVSSRLH